MIKLPPPITQKTFTNIVSEWASITKRNESVSILHLSNREQLYRIDQLLQDKKMTSLFSPFRIIVLNLASLPLDDAEELEAYLAKKRGKNKRSVALFILTADRLLDEKQSLLASFNSLPHRNPEYKLVFFFQKNILLPHYLDKLSCFSTLYQNIRLYPFYEQSDRQQFIRYLGEKFNVRLPKRVIDVIIDHCGGHLWLIKEAVRYYMHTHDTNKFFNHKEMLFRLQIVWNEFDLLEQKVLEKLVCGNLIIDDKERKILDHFVQIRLLKRNNAKYVFTIPVLAGFIKEQNSRNNKLGLNEFHQITLNGVTIEEYFTVREKRLLKFFLQSSSDTPILREKAASIIWKQEEYTDWALDQFIRRLRNKFITLGLGRNILTTVRNKGYILFSHSL